MRRSTFSLRAVLAILLLAPFADRIETAELHLEDIVFLLYATELDRTQIRLGPARGKELYSAPANIPKEDSAKPLPGARTRREMPEHYAGMCRSTTPGMPRETLWQLLQSSGAFAEAPVAKVVAGAICSSTCKHPRRRSMRIRADLLAGGLTLALSAPAMAFQCPSDIAKIDQAMQTASLSQEQMNQAMQLRDKGERLHSEGKHQEAVDTLAQAKQMHGIQ